MNTRARKIVASVTVAVTAMLVPATSAHASASSTFIRFFDNANWVGSAYYTNGDGGKCWNLPATWQRRISSVQSDTRWTLYRYANCYTEGGQPGLDHTGDLSYVGDAMNDRGASFRVY